MDSKLRTNAERLTAHNEHVKPIETVEIEEGREKKMELFGPLEELSF